MAESSRHSNSMESDSKGTPSSSTILSYIKSLDQSLPLDII